jgi:hypothetical protein
MLIPEYAHSAFVALLDWTRKMYSPNFLPMDRQEAKRNYKREELDMIKYLNPIPYEWMVQSGPMFNHFGHVPFYRGVHSDFLHGQPPTVPTAATPGCVPGCAPVVNHITNIHEAATAPKLPLIGVVGEGGPTDPVPDATTFQHDSLIGLGNYSNGKVKIEVDDQTMASYGQNKTFDFNTVTGTISFTVASGYRWMAGSSLWINLNQ